jgi:AcrR family transcriptional regulator
MSSEREALLASAGAMFRESGLAGMTREAVARLAGVPPATARQVFPAREDLVRAVYEQALVGMAMDSFATLPESGLRDQLRYLLRVRYEFFASHRESSRQVLFGALSAGGGWRDPFEEQFWRFSVQVVALLQAARRQGEVRLDADDALAARAFVSYYLTGILLVLRDEKTTAQAACDFTFPLVDALLASLA